MQQNFLFKPTAKALKTFKIFDSTLPTSWEQTGAIYGNLAHFLHNIFQSTDRDRTCDFHQFLTNQNF